MIPVIFPLFDNSSFIQALHKALKYEIGKHAFHFFPDGEVLVRIMTTVQQREVILAANLNQPNAKILPLLFAAETAKDHGAKKVTLLSPYLPYMRQDKQFNQNEGITSRYFASLISKYFDQLITFDPHLHRLKSLSEIYAIPTITLNANEKISEWIKEFVNDPIIIGPDGESEALIQKIATSLNSPYLILEKKRLGDRDIEIVLPKLNSYLRYTPVIVDDIISSGVTMIKAVEAILKNGMRPPVCIGIHAVFSSDAYLSLLKSGVSKIVTCNTITHVSNEIDLSAILIKAFR